jgi:hypothetical protein
VGVDYCGLDIGMPRMRAAAQPAYFVYTRGPVGVSGASPGVTLTRGPALTSSVDDEQRNTPGTSPWSLLVTTLGAPRCKLQQTTANYRKLDETQCNWLSSRI